MIDRLLTAIGSDRHLRPGQLRMAGAMPAEAWRLYDSAFDRFTGARLDPQFARLDHPAARIADPKVAPGTTIVIAGAGPSLRERAADLRRLRRHVSIWTSLRGAEALAALDLNPDLVIVQHLTDLDAYLTQRHLRDRDGVNPLGGAPLVIAAPQTPTPILLGVPRDRIAVVDPALGWGHWSATLTALACSSGAAAVALVGVDLGSPSQPDPAHAPVRLLLELIARGSSINTFDAGDGAAKTGWPRQRIDSIVEARGSRAVTNGGERWASTDERHAALDASLREIRDHVEAAAEFCSRALINRAAGGRADGPLNEAWSVLMSWRESQSVRTAFQEGLGVRFLPQFWRRDRIRLAGPAWRPVLLATDEVVRQAHVAHSHLRVAVPA